MAYLGFKALEGKLAGRPGVTNPAALSAVIGANKYGKGAMQKAAASGQSLRGVGPASKRRRKRRGRRAASVGTPS